MWRTISDTITADTHRGISGGQENGERWRKINILVTKGDEDTPTSATHLTVEDRVENRIIALHILRSRERNVITKNSSV